MICRHSPGDPDCSKNGGGWRAYAPSYSSSSNEPDPKDYAVEAVYALGNFLVLKVKYPSCSKCAYEGNKVLVYENVTTATALMWNEIDPHFADPKKKKTNRQAPAPIARFPASEAGWREALAYVEWKHSQVLR